MLVMLVSLDLTSFVDQLSRYKESE